jgi:hypothetical protein
MTICLFLDTAVFMGYVFPNDRWERAAYNCILAKRKKFTSNKVEGELRKKTDYATRRIAGEMRRFAFDLSGKKPDTVVQDNDIQRILGSITDLKIGPALRELFGDPARKGITYGQLRELLNNIQWDYLGMVHVRTKQAEEMLAKLDIESWSRFAPYPEIEAGLSAIVKNSSDVQLLLDAHDLASTQNVVLDFVTGDWTDIKGNEIGILALVKLKKITYLAEFENAS